MTTNQPHLMTTTTTATCIWPPLTTHVQWPWPQSPAFQWPWPQVTCYHVVWGSCMFFLSLNDAFRCVIWAMVSFFLFFITFTQSRPKQPQGTCYCVIWGSWMFSLAQMMCLKAMVSFFFHDFHWVKVQMAPRHTLSCHLEFMNVFFSPNDMFRHVIWAMVSVFFCFSLLPPSQGQNGPKQHVIMSFGVHTFF